MSHIAVIDVGKTNAKLALVERNSLEEVAVITRPNVVLNSGPYPHFDLDGHWSFFLEGLAEFHTRYAIDAISVTTHGAAVTLIGHDGHALPMLDYEFNGPDRLTTYDNLRPDFADTGSPRLPMGLNVGAQLHWMFANDPSLKARVKSIVTYPQYWGYRLTGVLATDMTSLGCHTDLWEPVKGQLSGLVDALGIRNLIAPVRRSSDVLGGISTEVAERTGLKPDTEVVVGIHDSNASLYPHLLGRSAPFSVVSTGTWVICMAMGGNAPALDPTRDTLINVNALGQPVPTARFMGGREFELLCKGREIAPDDADRRSVLNGVYLLPALERGTGPFAHCRSEWIGTPETPGQEMVAFSYYLAMMTDVCLSLTGAKGPVIVEGPFSNNSDFLAMLSALRHEGVEVASSATGTSVGAALLCIHDVKAPATRSIFSNNPERLCSYARKWSQLRQSPA